MNEMLRSLPRRDDEVPPTLRSPDGVVVSSATFRRAPAVELLEVRAPRHPVFNAPALSDLADSRLARWLADPPSLARRGVARLVEAAFHAIGGDMLGARR